MTTTPSTSARASDLGRSVDRPDHLAEVRQAILTGDEAERLFDEIAREGEVLAIRAKGRSGRRALDEDLALDDARRIIAAHDAAGLQIRYRYDDAEWCDTLLRHGDGFRLVRMRNDHHSRSES